MPEQGHYIALALWDIFIWATKYGTFESSFFHVFMCKKGFRFLTTSLAQTTQTEEFMFQNVAYRSTVFKTGVCTNKLHRIKVRKP